MNLFKRLYWWWMRLLNPDQAWFWTPRWQAMEAEAEADIRAGRYQTFNNADDFIAWLEEEIA